MTLRSFIKVLRIIFILSVLYVAVKWGLFLIVDFGFPKEAKDIALREVVHPNYRYSKDTLFDTYHVKKGVQVFSFMRYADSIYPKEYNFASNQDTTYYHVQICRLNQAKLKSNYLSHISNAPTWGFDLLKNGIYQTAREDPIFISRINSRFDSVKFEILDSGKIDYLWRDKFGFCVMGDINKCYISRQQFIQAEINLDVYAPPVMLLVKQFNDYIDIVCVSTNDRGLAKEDLKIIDPSYWK